jgi:basic membrane lipoprotein Med (substrate-binding protein (PBP1-ABC) superfamily)
LALTLALLASSCSPGAAGNGEQISACEILLGRAHDGGINAAAHEGLNRAKTTFGVDSKVQTGYEANMESPARGECDAIVAVG